MFCKNCGKELGDAEKFCSSCGHAVEAVTNSDNTPQTVNQMATDNIAQQKTPIGLMILGFFLPLVGIIISFVKISAKKPEDQRAIKAILIASCAGFIFFFVIGFSKTILTNVAKQSPVATAENASPNDSIQSQQSDAAVIPPEIEWNKTDIDVTTNGNISVAVAKLASQKPYQIRAAAKNIKAAEALTAPWKYYDQVYKFTGVANLVDTYPPGSDLGANMGITSEFTEVVFPDMNDGTIIDFLCIGEVSGKTSGSTVSVYGYITGKMEVPNAIGGTFTHLIVVGNTVQ